MPDTIKHLLRHLPAVQDCERDQRRRLDLRLDAATLGDRAKTSQLLADMAAYVADRAVDEIAAQTAKCGPDPAGLDAAALTGDHDYFRRFETGLEALGVLRDEARSKAIGLEVEVGEAAAKLQNDYLALRARNRKAQESRSRSRPRGLGSLFGSAAPVEPSRPNYDGFRVSAQKELHARAVGATIDAALLRATSQSADRRLSELEAQRDRTLRAVAFLQEAVRVFVLSLADGPTDRELAPCDTELDSDRVAAGIVDRLDVHAFGDFVRRCYPQTRLEELAPSLPHAKTVIDDYVAWMLGEVGRLEHVESVLTACYGADRVGQELDRIVAVASPMAPVDVGWVQRPHPDDETRGDPRTGGWKKGVSCSPLLVREDQDRLAEVLEATLREAGADTVPRPSVLDRDDPVAARFLRNRCFVPAATIADAVEELERRAAVLPFEVTAHAGGGSATDLAPLDVEFNLPRPIPAWVFEDRLRYRLKGGRSREALVAEFDPTGDAGLVHVFERMRAEDGGPSAAVGVDPTPEPDPSEADGVTTLVVADPALAATN